MDDDQTSTQYDAATAHEVLTPLTVAKGRLHLVRRYLRDADGARVDDALASRAVAERHVDRAAAAVRRRTRHHAGADGRHGR